MQRVGPRIVVSPSDLNHFLECEYLTRLDVEAADGRVFQKLRSPEAELLAAKGDAHESASLARFRADGRNVAVIEDPSRIGWSTAAQATRQAMVAGADVIYQGVLLDDGWRGRADFLVRVGTRSSLGAWSYEAWDTKLARHVKPSHILQLAYYSNGIASIQGRESEWMRVVLGTGETARFAVRDFAAYFRAVCGRFGQALSEGAAAHPFPVSHCQFCGYVKHCGEWWRSRDHLSQIAAIQRSQVERLEQAGVRTCAELGGTSQLQVAIGDSTLQRLRQQARLQSTHRVTGAHRYELLPVTEESGFSLLPPPSQGDVFFDMEGFPFFDPSKGLEYLFGAVTADSGQVSFRPFWATDRAGEKRGFEQFVDFLWERLRRWPDLHVYHYAHYEPTALKRLMSEHATREEELDELLRREVFVDLFQVVRRSMRISHDSYSLKAVRQFVMPDAGKGEVTGGGESIVEFQRWLDTGEQRILDAIERYNEEDCVSTLRLRDWLLERRTEAEQQFDVAIPFLALSKQRQQATGIRPDDHADRRARLDALGADWARTIGHLLDYHRRESKPEWWAYFQRRKKSLDELLDDTEAIAHLTAVPGVAPRLDKHSLVYPLEFPAQEFKLKVDSAVEGALGEGPVGSIEWIDASAGRLGLRRGKGRHTEPLPRAIIAGAPIPDKAQREAVVRVADAAVAGLDRYSAVQDILTRRTPRFSSPRSTIQTLVLEEQKRLISDLRDSYLFVQGPPGSGKTWAGARLIVDLIGRGKRVGVMAPSHRAIHNLLAEVEAVAAAEGVTFVGLKKRSVSNETVFEGRNIRSVGTNAECEESTAQLVAATAWLFAREGMDQSLDYLFVDEAGQVSLADTVAVGTCARNIVLLGDPQQLPHVTQNSHPEGAGVSVLEHLLGDAATVATDRGIFLAHSWRMHPDVCRFVADHSYDGRLSSAAGCERQAIASTGLAGAGLRYIPVDHRHNAQQSTEEAEAIASEARILLQTGKVTDTEGVTRTLTSADILIVTPYNMQVRCLREALPAGIEVGTVDKFQGREAPVVFFSMSSSTGDDVPRGLEFLFNRNRFNVAISRAKCLAVVVCSPRLLEAQCRTVGQMRLVNGLCSFVEFASNAAFAGVRCATGP